MEKLELKDVAHLYVGQKMLSWWGDIQEKQTIKGVIGSLVVFRYSEDDGVQDSLDLSFKQKKGKEPKLILRPLSDMKESEALAVGYSDQHEFFEMMEEVGMELRIKPEDYSFLLEQGFDLFGLIESGQAIKATE